MLYYQKQTLRPRDYDQMTPYRPNLGFAQRPQYQRDFAPAQRFIRHSMGSQQSYQQQSYQQQPYQQQSYQQQSYQQRRSDPGGFVPERQSGGYYSQQQPSGYSQRPPNSNYRQRQPGGYFPPRQQNPYNSYRPNY